MTEQLRASVLDIRLWLTSPPGTTATLSATVGGKTFYAVYDPSRPEVNHYYPCQLEAERSLLWFINEFYFRGCGGGNHKFQDDPDDPALKCICIECGAVKPRGMVLSKALGQVRTDG